MRRKTKRGVSPIIATILLVAITVVLAAVLYVLVSGLTKSGASVPYELGMSEIGNGGSGHNYTLTVSIQPTSGLLTSAFGLKVSVPGGLTTYPTVAISGTGCTVAAATNVVTSCTGTLTGWYGVVVSLSTGYIVAIYSGTAPAWTYVTGTTLALTGGYQLWLVSYGPLAGTGDTLAAFPTGSSSVSGQTSL
jgi:flagellin-like protein